MVIVSSPEGYRRETRRFGSGRGAGLGLVLGEKKNPLEHLTVLGVWRVPRTSTVVPRVVRHMTRVLTHTASQRRHHGNPFSTPHPPTTTVDEDYHHSTAVMVAAWCRVEVFTR